MCMKKYFIAQDTIDHSDELVRSSFLAKPERKGFIRLYNKNAWRTTYHRIVEQSYNRRGWIVEVGKVPAYWKNHFLPILITNK